MTPPPVAVLTGAGGGLGAAVATALAAAGSPVACADLDAGAAQRTAEAVIAAGGAATAHAVDVTDPTAVSGWHEAVRSALGPAGIVVNAAGAMDRGGPSELDHAGFMRVVDVNLGGTYAVIREFLPDLADAGRGRIVNIASIAGLVGYPFPSYTASKSGVVGLTRSLLIDLWGTGITINAVCPGAMDTAMFNAARIPDMVRRTPLGRIVTVDEVAATVAFLCSDAAAGINGASIPVDGGATTAFRYAEG
ncbi:SDR family NAD(P)-dependent oxidoreductase [Pseudonocardia sp. MH-G8]|uniref:SDR family NAD(P)-dependent oxidoreductase n=1 Tax=Pseudonocardia sp. MH-G8 TaxID=1854588 RepID=UPI0013041D30|nr:SDR family oxidoreductase [Pseudonocardia sp. MH-G8]